MKHSKHLKILVALSGGVDSAMAAALLLNAGHRVHGLHFVLPSPQETSRKRTEKAHKIAEHLQIPLETKDLRSIFEKDLIAPFVDTYLKGRTPNPCVRCNPRIKFQQMLGHLEAHEFDFMATGHYVRLRRTGKKGALTLLRGKDPRKDQSYFLHRLNLRQLSKTIFPLGRLTKSQTRELARQTGIPGFDDPESQEICFIPDMDYRHFIESRMKGTRFQKGPIVGPQGEILGEHDGIHRYTIGQRHGLGIASSRPWYVKALDPKGNRVVVARREDLFSRGVLTKDFHWLTPLEKAHDKPLMAQIRYRHKPAEGRLERLSAGRVRFVFDRPQTAVTPGQALVCYAGEQVMGGGWIVGDI